MEIYSLFYGLFKMRNYKLIEFYLTIGVDINL